MPTFHEFRLPDVGEGLTEAEIVSWHVAPGQTVNVNDVLVEIETAKSIVELPSPVAGVVATIVAAEGATMEVGDVIVTIDIDPDGPPAEPPAAGSAGASAPAEPGSAGAAPASEPTTAEPAAVPADAAGATEPVAGTAGAVAGTADPGDAAGAVLVGYGSGASTPNSRRSHRHQRAPQPVGAAAGPAYQPAFSTARVLAKPPVRKLARDLGIDLAAVSPTGPGGIITREDVLAHAEEAKPQPLATYAGDEPWLESGTVSPDGRLTRVPVRAVRKRTAEAMVRSAFTAPHVTEFHTVDVTRTMRLVEKLKGDREFADTRVSPLLIVAKALLLAVRRHPEINASWDEERQEIVYKHYVNLGIAAATPRGLVVPNIKDAHRLGLHDIAVRLAELTAAARAGKATPADMRDGTITITNVGSFGIDTGTPILNPGEAAILAFGTIRQQPWVHKGKVKVRWVTQLALSFDHRLVDGALGSVVLSDVAAVLADPAQAMVWG